MPSVLRWRRIASGNIPSSSAAEAAETVPVTIEGGGRYAAATTPSLPVGNTSLEVNDRSSEHVLVCSLLRSLANLNTNLSLDSASCDFHILGFFTGLNRFCCLPVGSKCPAPTGWKDALTAGISQATGAVGVCYARLYPCCRGGLGLDVLVT